MFLATATVGFQAKERQNERAEVQTTKCFSSPTICQNQSPIEKLGRLIDVGFKIILFFPVFTKHCLDNQSYSRIPALLSNDPTLREPSKDKEKAIFEKLAVALNVSVTVTTEQPKFELN